MSKELLPDDLLKESLRKAQEIKCSAYERKIEQPGKHVFSEEYRIKVKILEGELEKEVNIRNYKIKKKSLKLKILLIAAIVMLMGSMTVLAVEPLREMMYQLIENIFMDHTDVSFEVIEKDIQSNNKNITPDNFEVKKLKNVPNEYELLNEEAIPEICFYCAEYEDYDNQIIRYQQRAVEYIDIWSITSDGTSAETISVNGDVGYLLVDNENYNFILYPCEGYVYSISGYNEIEQLVRLLELVL